MNRNESSFNKVIAPPINELTEEKVGLISLSDEKLIMILHNNLLKEMSVENNWSVGKTVNFINALNKAVHMRT